MQQASLRISRKTQELLCNLAEETGETMTTLVDKAIDAYWRLKFLERANAEYATLRADPDAWKDELAERTLWEATLMDGLEDEMPYHSSQ